MSNANKSFLPDEAIDNAKKFGFEDYSILLSNIIRDPSLQTPFTIAIYGDWGSGKTSLMRTISKKLQTESSVSVGVKIIWFSAWEFEKLSTPLWTIFLNRVIMDLQEMAPEGERREKIKAAGKGLLLLTSNIALQRIVGISSKDVEEIKERVWSDIKSINSLKEELSSYVRTALEHDPEHRKRIAILVDDLDRCLPEQCMEIFESMKLFLNCPDCIFVVGVDKEQIKNVFERKFQSNNQKGHGYIEKFVQLEFDLPPKTPDEVKDFLFEHASQQLQENPKTIELISRFIEPNPRKIKRWLNSVFFLENLFKIKQNKQNIAEVDLSLASIWLFLKSFFPDFATIIEREPSLLNTSIKVARGTGSEIDAKKIGDFKLDKRLSEFLSLLKPNYFDDQLRDLIYLSKLTPVSQVSVLPKDIIERISDMTQVEFSDQLNQLDRSSIISLTERIIENLSQIPDWTTYNSLTKQFDVLHLIVLRALEETFKITIFDRIIQFMLDSPFAYRYFVGKLEMYIDQIGKETLIKHNFTDRLILVYAKSSSFDIAGSNSGILLSFADSISEKQLNTIADIFLRNDQITSSWNAQKNIKKLLLQSPHKLSQDRLEKTNELIDMTT